MDIRRIQKGGYKMGQIVILIVPIIIFLIPIAVIIVTIKNTFSDNKAYDRNAGIGYTGYNIKGE